MGSRGRLKAFLRASWVKGCTWVLQITQKFHIGHLKPIDLLGWAASLCFAVCPLPQVLQCFRQGHAQGISEAFLWIWLIGEFLMVTYLTCKAGQQGPIIVTFVVNVLCVLVIMWFLYIPRS